MGPVSLVIYVLVFCIVAALVYYIITKLLPEPLQNIALAIAAVIGGLFLIMFLLNIAGLAPLNFRLGKL